MREKSVSLEKGQRIYYGGDVANEEGFGVITSNHSDKWGTYVKVKLDDGREFTLSPSSFSSEYLGHGGTKFVTEEAYRDWRKAQIKLLQDRMS